jgi:hypothetical protein
MLIFSFTQVAVDGLVGKPVAQCQYRLVALVAQSCYRKPDENADIVETFLSFFKDVASISKKRKNPAESGPTPKRRKNSLSSSLPSSPGQWRMVVGSNPPKWVSHPFKTTI